MVPPAGLGAADGTRPPAVSDPVIDYVPTGRPGHRAPHLILQRDGAELSTLDLFDGGFTLLAGARGRAWVTSAQAACERWTLPLQTMTVGPDADLADPADRWGELYGVGPEGAVLVRPDGHVAWRSAAASSDPGAEIGRALARACGR